MNDMDELEKRIGGSGRLGKRRADPVTVRFAGGHPPYGPIATAGEPECEYEAGPRGLALLALRLPALG